MASPDHNDVRSPSEVSSGVNMDPTDKPASPNDSGTVSPNDSGTVSPKNEAVNEGMNWSYFCIFINIAVYLYNSNYCTCIFDPYREYRSRER